MDLKNKEAKETSSNNHKSTIIISILVTLLIISLAANAVLGVAFNKEINYHKETRNERDQKIQELVEKSQKLEANAQVIQDAELEPKYWGAMQENANRQCHSPATSALVFNTTTSPEKNADGSVKKYFAVGKYVCNSGNTVFQSDIRFIVLQSRDMVNWEFTYGSSSSDPNALPGYVYDTNPSLYKRKYNNPNRS